MLTWNNLHAGRGIHALMQAHTTVKLYDTRYKRNERDANVYVHVGRNYKTWRAIPNNHAWNAGGSETCHDPNGGWFVLIEFGIPARVDYLDAHATRGVHVQQVYATGSTVKEAVRLAEKIISHGFISEDGEIYSNLANHA